MRKDEMKYPSFIQIPYKILSDKKLQSLDTLIYGFIYWYANLTLRKCIASNGAMAELLNCKLNSVAHSLARLEKQGHIKRIFQDKAKRIRKEIIPLTPLDDGRRMKINWDEVIEIASDNYDLGYSEFWHEKEINSDLFKEIMREWKKFQD